MSTSALICQGTHCRRARRIDTSADRQVSALAEVGQVRVVDCVDQCDNANVMVVRAGDNSKVWLTGVLTSAATDALSAWIDAGAPLPVPTLIADYVFVPERGATRRPSSVERSFDNDRR